MEREIILESFKMKVLGTLSVIQKVIIKKDCKITGIYRYYLDKVTINKQSYLNLKNQYDKQSIKS